jgi:hypothetical protein
MKNGENKHGGENNGNGISVINEIESVNQRRNNGGRKKKNGIVAKKKAK